MTTTDEQFVSDNSTTQDETQISQSQEKIVSEPEAKTDEAVNEALNPQNFEIPEKFRNKDGSANISSLVKSYKELEPLVNEKANWVKERENLTSQLSDFQNRQLTQNSAFSLISANLYEKYLQKATDKDLAKSLIEQIKNNPSSDAIKELESLFPQDVMKNVYFESIGVSNIVSQMRSQAIQDSEMKAAESYLKDVVEKNFEELKNPVTAQIFNEVFMRFGSNLDSEWFFGTLKELKKSFILEYQKSQSMKEEKDAATGNASELSPKNSSKGGTSLLHRNALDLSPQELDRMLDEFYSK